MTRPRTRPVPGRGRGRPLLFDDTQKKAYLKHVTAGLTLNEAAAAVGIDRRTVNHHTTTDPRFREARDTAKAAGRAARWDDKPHNEYRYIHGGCRCPQCTTAASSARAARRAEPPPPAADTPRHAPTVIPLPNRDIRPDQHLPPLAAVS
ncbi:hypothetical protein OV320_2593 [Actinobacteria bacterium OV320]|nr:hypothetical protein OV320_2593 [Actinobacteria bacterium OV320]